MKDSEIVEKLNVLLSSAEIYKGMLNPAYTRNSVVHFCHFFPKNEEMYAFRLSIDYADIYKNIFWEIYNKGVLRERYTIEYFKNQFQLYLIDLKVKNLFATERNYKKFFNKFNMAPTTKMKVFHQIYGLDINDTTPYQIGCFTFYNYSLHKDKLIEIMGFQTEEDLLFFHSEFTAHNEWICTEIEAVDSGKAYELACERFEVFQGICQFILDIKGYNAHAVSVLSDVQSYHSSFLVASDTGIREGTEKHITRFRNCTMDAFTNEEHHLYPDLLNRLFVSEKSEVLNRVKNAFTTYGRILHERSDTQKFAMYITTIESLIEYDQKNLTELISGYLAGMISDDIDSYNANKEHFKFIYDLRSEILHGSRTSVLKGDLEYAKAYAVELILKFITDKEIEPICKNKDLKMHLESKIKRLEVQAE